MDAEIPFKVFGLQRTCTNLMVHLLKLNFLVQPTEAGGHWKHGPARGFPWEFEGHAVRLVICVKDPLAWLDSFYRWCRRNARADGEFSDPGLHASKFDKTYDFAQFLHSPCYDQPTPMDRWNQLNRHWLELSGDDRLVQVVRAEDVYAPAGQRRTLRRIEREFGLSRRCRLLHVEPRRVAVSQRVTDKPMNPEYFQQHVYLQSYTADLLDFLSRRVDHDLMARLNYRLPSRRELPSPAE